MKIKGTTIIELTDVNTGEVTTVEEENMITNALSYFFNSNPLGAFTKLNESNTLVAYNDKFIPMCPKILGGIMLFSEKLEEDVDNIFPKSSLMPMGYAANNANPYEDTKRGSMNLNESMPITNGYKFVWDFATSQGNGTIAAVALTSCYGGEAVYGSIYDDTSPFLLIKSESLSSFDSTVRWMYSNAVELDAENEIMYCISYSTSGITISKIRQPVHSIGLNDDLCASTYELLDEQVIVPSTFKFPTYIYYNGAFYDGRDGYWYGLGHTTNSSGSATVYWIKIDKSDYSFTEGTWTLSNTTLEQAGNYRYSSSPFRFTEGCVRNGYYYITSYSRTGVYKIAIDNPADITLLELGITTEDRGLGSYANNGTAMTVIENIIIARDYMIMEDDTVVLTKGDEKFTEIGTPVFQWRQFLFVWEEYYRSVYLLTPFLATINNLDTAVVKTADKTMKITYTLTQE